MLSEIKVCSSWLLDELKFWDLRKTRLDPLQRFSTNFKQFANYGPRD